MSFITHLQSSLILGTKMVHPDEEHFNKQLCKELFSYIKQDDISKLKQLILSGADSDKCEENHIRALSYAVKTSKLEAVKLLLYYGCDLNFVDCFNRRALDYALETKNKAIISLLEMHGAISSTQPQEVYYASDNITQAAINGDLDALIYYQHLGANIHQKYENKTTLLHLAIDSQSENMLVYLLNKGLNIDARDKSGTTPLILASMDIHNLSLLSILLKRNATLDQRNNRRISALSMAIKRYNIKAAIMLVQHGADVNIRDSINTPLTLVHSSINTTSNTILKQELRNLETLLLVKNAHVNSNEDKLMWSPLMLTASHYQDNGNILHLQLLIHLGANINQRDKNSRSALMIAASLGRIEAIEILLKHNAKLNLADKFGWTALMLGVYYNQKETVTLLLNNGADVNFCSKKGLTALKVATDNERMSIIPILRNYGAVSPKE